MYLPAAAAAAVFFSAFFGKQSDFEKFSNHFTWVIIMFGIRMDDGTDPCVLGHYTEGIIEAQKT